jgi:hypothetical protein
MGSAPAATLPSSAVRTPVVSWSRPRSRRRPSAGEDVAPEQRHDVLGGEDVVRVGRVAPVSTVPGEIALTRIGASSTATAADDQDGAAGQ